MCAAEGLCSGQARSFLLFYLNLPSQRNHDPTEPTRTQPSWYLLRSVGLRPCARCASLDPAAFISYSFTKTPYPLCHLIPTENTRTRTKTCAWTGVQLHLNAQEMNVALHLCWINSTGFASAFVLRISPQTRSLREGGVYSHCCDVRCSNESTCCWTGSFKWFVLNDSKGCSHRTNSDGRYVTTLFVYYEGVLP